jgi:hypothetical protein
LRILRVIENTFGFINMFGFVGVNGNDDNVTMFLSLVFMLEFIFLYFLFKMVNGRISLRFVSLRSEN